MSDGITYLVSRFSSSSALSLLDLQKQQRKVSFFLSSRTSSSGAIWALFPCPWREQQWWWWVILTLACPEPLALAFKVTWWWLSDLERDLEVGGDDERDRLRWCSIKGCFGPELKKNTLKLKILPSKFQKLICYCFPANSIKRFTSLFWMKFTSVIYSKHTCKWLCGNERKIITNQFKILEIQNSVCCTIKVTDFTDNLMPNLMRKVSFMKI